MLIRFHGFTRRRSIKRSAGRCSGNGRRSRGGLEADSSNASTAAPYGRHGLGRRNRAQRHALQRHEAVRPRPQKIGRSRAKQGFVIIVVTAALALEMRATSCPHRGGERGKQLKGAVSGKAVFLFKRAPCPSETLPGAVHFPLRPIGVVHEVPPEIGYFPRPDFANSRESSQYGVIGV